MIEQIADEPAKDGALAAAEPTSAPVTAPVTAGALLREARQRSGLHIAALAVSLKVPVRKLEALETDQYHLLTDAVFTRALAASVCRALKLDAAPVMALLPAPATPSLGASSDSLNAPFRGPERHAGSGIKGWLSRPAVIAAAVLVVAAGVLVLVPGPRPEASRDPSRPDAAPALPAVAVEPPPPSFQPLPEPAATAASAVAMPAAPPARAVSAPAPAAAVVAPASLVAASALRGAVRFSTSGPSWIEVVDATGSITLRRVVGPNELAEVTGPTPLRITVGSASTTRVEVRGQTMDLVPVTRDNVARFEVQ